MSVGKGSENTRVRALDYPNANLNRYYLLMIDVHIRLIFQLP